MWSPIHKRSNNFNAVKTKRVKYRDSFLLDKPKTEKLNGINIIRNGLEFGHSSMQGYRVNMEDEYCIEAFSQLKDHNIVGIFDGHNGKVAAQYASAQILTKVESTEEWIAYTALAAHERSKHTDLLSKALVKSYLSIDADLVDADFMDKSGCTAVCAIITPSHIICANVGDSRCVIGTRDPKKTPSTCTIAMTDDHKPSNPEELRRIENGGGFVQADRVNGSLAMSRALGDFCYKLPMKCVYGPLGELTEKSADPDDILSDREYLVIAYPDVSIYERNRANDQVLLLACDGIWDVLDNDAAIEYLLDIVWKDEKGGQKLCSSQEAAESLIVLALSMYSTDNMSAVIVKLSPKLLSDNKV